MDENNPFENRPKSARIRPESVRKPPIRPPRHRHRELKSTIFYLSGWRTGESAPGGLIYTFCEPLRVTQGVGAGVGTAKWPKSASAEASRPAPNFRHMDSAETFLILVQYNCNINYRFKKVPSAIATTEGTKKTHLPTVATGPTCTAHRGNGRPPSCCASLGSPSACCPRPLAGGGVSAEPPEGPPV